MYVPREIESKIQRFIKRKEVIAIHGPRRVGKTILLEQLTKKFPKKKILNITFEDRENLRLFENDIEDFKRLCEGFDIVTIDELQYAKEGGQKLKYLYDTTPTKFIVTGSSSLELTYQTGKYMVGRMFNFNLWPLSFKEYFSHVEPTVAKILQRQKSLGDTLNQKIEKHFEDYLIYGGYPAVLLAKTKEEKGEILKSILENYLLRDIRSLLQLSTDDELVRLTRLLGTQIGNLIEYRELGTSSGLGFNSLKKHLRILQGTYIVDLIRPYFKNKRTELVKNPKAYFIDSGFRNLAIQDFKSLSLRGDAGAMVENFVFMHYRRMSSVFSPIRFWRTKSGAEVDFVLEENGVLTPIEVKYSRQPTIGKSLYSFIEKFKPKKAIIYTKGVTAKEKVRGCTIDFIPVYYL